MSNVAEHIALYQRKLEKYAKSRETDKVRQYEKLRQLVRGGGGGGEVGGEGMWRSPGRWLGDERQMLTGGDG